MKFSKIRYAGGTVELVMTESPSKHDTDERTRTSTDTPRPEFVAALKALAQDVVRICEQPPEHIDDIEVVGISITQHSKTERRSFVISAKRPVEEANGPFVLNTPRMSEFDLDGGRGTLPEETTERLLAVIAEAERFLEGKRAQQEMFGGQENGAETNDDEVTVKKTAAVGPTEGGAAAAEEWLPYECPTCHTHRSYPADDPTPQCPLGCGVGMVALDAEKRRNDADPEPAAEASEPSLNGTAPASGEQPLEDRTEFTSRRAITALHGAGIYDVGQLLNRVERTGGRGWLAQVKGLGQKGRKEVYAVIDALELEAVEHANGEPPTADVEEEVGAAVGAEDDDDLPF